jgi:hypothetical protein
MLKSAAMMVLVVALTAGVEAQEARAGALEIGSATGQPGEVVSVPIYGTFTAPLVFLTIPFQFDADNLECLSYTLAGTVGEGQRMGIEFNNFEPGDAICGIGQTGAPVWERITFAPGERVFLGSLRFQVLATAVTGAASVTPVRRVPETAGTVNFSLRTEDGLGAPIYVPEPLIGGGVMVIAPSGPRPVGDFRCEQFLDRAVLSFTLTEAYDRIDVLRDGQVIASLSGPTTAFSDPLPGLGTITYGAKAWRGGRGSITVECVLESRPPAAPPITSLECAEGSLSWTLPMAYDRLFLYRDGQPIATLAGGEQSYHDPDPPASLALYAIVGELDGYRSPEVNCLDHGVWIYEVGDVLVPLGASRVTVPIFVTNARSAVAVSTCLEVDTARFKPRLGMKEALAGTVGYPEPEFFAGGPNGWPCGFPILSVIYDFNAPRNPEKYLPVGLRQHVMNFVLEPQGTFADGETFELPARAAVFTVSGAKSRYPDVVIPGMVRFGSGGLPAVGHLAARLAAPAGGGAAGGAKVVALTWQNAAEYEAIRIERNGAPLAEVPGGTMEFMDAAVSSGIFTYKVSAIVGGKASFPASAFLSTFTPPGTFLRGDANRDSRVDIADVVFILGALFYGGALSCRDAADSNDDGFADLTDAIHLLGFLFLGGEAPRAPGVAYPWFDPTPDGLGCEG